MTANGLFPAAARIAWFQLRMIPMSAACLMYRTRESPNDLTTSGVSSVEALSSTIKSSSTPCCESTLFIASRSSFGRLRVIMPMLTLGLGTAVSLQVEDDQAIVFKQAAAVSAKFPGQLGVVLEPPEALPGEDNGLGAADVLAVELGERRLIVP